MVHEEQHPVGSIYVGKVCGKLSPIGGMSSGKGSEEQEAEKKVSCDHNPHSQSLPKCSGKREEVGESGVKMILVRSG